MCAFLILIICIRSFSVREHCIRMSRFSFLEFQYEISKMNLLRKPGRIFSLKNRHDSSFFPPYQPDMNELKRIFDKFDSNKDGKISPKEYKSILKALGNGNFSNEVPEIFQAADLDGDGFIDFEEFVEAHKTEGGVRTMDIQSAFRIFDLDGDGKISAEEVLRLLKRLGERCNLQECRKMVGAADSNGDGVIDMDEFMTMMTRTMKLD